MTKENKIKEIRDMLKKSGEFFNKYMKFSEKFKLSEYETTDGIKINCDGNDLTAGTKVTTTKDGKDVAVDPGTYTLNDGREITIEIDTDGNSVVKEIKGEEAKTGDESPVAEDTSTSETDVTAKLPGDISTTDKMAPETESKNEADAEKQTDSDIEDRLSTLEEAVMQIMKLLQESGNKTETQMKKVLSAVEHIGSLPGSPKISLSKEVNLSASVDLEAELEKIKNYIKSPNRKYKVPQGKSFSK